MKQFEIEIEEILQRVINVDADSEEEAIRIVKEKYRNEEIVLDELDFKEVNIKNIKWVWYTNGRPVVWQNVYQVATKSS